jgi:hypothetical protein
MDKLMGNFEWDDGKIGLELKFKVLKNSSRKKEISPNGEPGVGFQEKEENFKYESFKLNLSPLRC